MLNYKGFDVPENPREVEHCSSRREADLDLWKLDPPRVILRRYADKTIFNTNLMVEAVYDEKDPTAILKWAIDAAGYDEIPDPKYLDGITTIRTRVGPFREDIMLSNEQLSDGALSIEDIQRNMGS